MSIFFLYIRNNVWYEQLDIHKIGISDNVIERDGTYITGEPIRGEYTDIWEISLISNINKFKIDKFIKNILKINLYHGNGGIEFYKGDKEIIIKKINNFLKKIEKLLTFKKLTLKEIKKLNRKSRINTLIKSLKRLNISWKKMSKVKRKINKPLIKYNWKERNYQKEAIKYCIKQLNIQNVIYIELATGGGKSFIIYKILSNIQPDVIVIFSPRKNINEQNISKKYLSILNGDYLAYNCSTGCSFCAFKKKCKKQEKKMIIVACPQKGNEKVFKIINENNLSNIAVWFDEAHHTIENWTTKMGRDYNDSIKFFLKDDNKIKNRIFTSASPNKKIVNENPNVFGELYNPIKVKELIKLKWLCPIIPHIFSLNEDNVDICSYNLDHFNKFNSTFGFSFHNLRDSACNLFLEHVKQYNEGKTKVKPFLLVGKDYKNPNLRNINLKYEYRDINEYEKTPNSMGYVVQQYSIGYDFKNIDYIIFSDPKMSHSDIIQCIGRGTRPDGKGENGRNLNKELSIMLPVFIEEEEGNEYKNIIEVLRYLVIDLGIDIESLFVNSNSEPKENDKQNELIGNNYCGSEKNKSILLDLLYENNILNRPTTTKTLIKFCKKYKIQNQDDYNIFKKENPHIKFKDNLYEYPAFNWKKIVDPNSEKYYKTLSECHKAKDKIFDENEKKFCDEEYEEFYDDCSDNGWKELHKWDSKIPPYTDLEKFYPKQ